MNRKFNIRMKMVIAVAMLVALVAALVRFHDLLLVSLGVCIGISGTMFIYHRIEERNT